MGKAVGMTDEVDVVVVGLGVGGEEVAGKLAEAGLSVVGIEPRLVGGECPYWGCVPSKMMIRAANALAEARRVEGLAGTVQVRPDWAPVARRIRQEATDSWNDQVAVDRLVGKGARFVRAAGRLAGPGRVVAGDHDFQARRGVVIATGTEPAIPPVPGLEDTPYWTNHEAIEADTLPESLIVLGGGAIGLELAQVFARFGVRVTVVEAVDRLLAFEEPESSALAEHALRADGIEVHTSAGAQRVDHSSAGFSVRLPEAMVHGDELLVSTGRRARLDALGLDTVGLDPGGRAIPTDERMRAAAGIWAVGDVTTHGSFTHLAMYHAGIVVADILGRPWPKADYRALPRVTFTDPEIGAVGLTEAQARAAGIPVRTGSTQVASTARGWIHKGEGFIKLVADADRGVLVGATSAGPVGGEVLSALAVAVHAEVPLDRLRHMIYAYPTFHRGIEDALRDLLGS
jgi:pyruvate/2-oxoglutarate dehydrogenase complex dihydrolipoamide dehydrogenase (E3) component